METLIAHHQIATPDTFCRAMWESVFVTMKKSKVRFIQLSWVVPNFPYVRVYGIWNEKLKQA